MHPSNFRTVGFVESVEIEELCGLGVPVIDDVGSGVLADEIGAAGRRAAGAPVGPRRAPPSCASPATSCSAARRQGCCVGTRDAVAACRRHPLARAVRIDKLSLAALEATLALYRDPDHARAAIPVLAMLTAGEDALGGARRAARGGHRRTVIRAVARVGGGALPLLELHGPAVALDPGPAGADALAAALRAGDPPLVGRIQDGRLLLDPRTLDDAEADAAAQVVASAYQE